MESKVSSSLPKYDLIESGIESKDGNNTTAGRRDSSEGGLSALALMFNMNSIGFITLLLYLLIVSRAKIIDISPIFLFYLSLIGLSLSTAVLAYTKLIKISICRCCYC